MKVTIFASVLAVLPGLVSSVAVPDATLEVSFSTVIPQYRIVIIREDEPDRKFGYSSYAQVSRVSGRHNTQSLISFKFNVGYPGKDCQFSFKNPAEATGSKKAQLFTVGGPITDQDTFNKRPFRDQYKGAFNSDGTWDSPGAPKFKCPTGPTTLNYECVPVGDDDYLIWDITKGLTITVL